MRLLTAAAFGLALGLAQPALAQNFQYGPYTPYGELLYTEGPGVKLGSGLVMHPGLATELGYDSNVLLSDNAQGAGLLRLRVHVDLSTLPLQRLDPSSNPKIEFRLGSAFEYRQYLSGEANIDYARQFNGFLDAYLAIKPRDPLSLRIYNNFIVTNDARNLEVATREAFAPRLYERLGLLGVFRPGNGPLELGLGTAFRLDYYFDQKFANNRSIGNDANIYASLRVLPQTTVKLEVRSSYVGYYVDNAGLPQALPVRVTLGVNSLILPALGVTAYVGYGNSLNFGTDSSNVKLDSPMTSDPRYNSFIGGAEVRVRLLSKMQLSLGWARDFFDSIFATYAADDRLYLHYDHFVWRGLALHLRLDTYFRDYGELVQASALNYTGYVYSDAATKNRKDILLNYNAEVSYRVLSWLELGVNYSLLYDKTDFAFCRTAGCSGSDRVAAQFIRHAILGRIDIAY